MPDTGKLFADFHNGLRWTGPLPEGISVINPYGNSEVKKVVSTFSRKFYSAKKKRILILGINPGRYGAGVTGIPFTDPVALEEFCGIPNSFEKKRELSSRFIYDMITVMGGPEFFYNHFLLSAICPLGFLKGIKNYNFYDQKDLLEDALPFIRASLENQARWNVANKVVVLGKKNSQMLEQFNRELKLFDSIFTLEHPRFIMQYRLKKKEVYLDNYKNQLMSLM